MKNVLMGFVGVLALAALGFGGYTIHEQRGQIDQLTEAVHDLEDSSSGGARTADLDTLRQQTADAVQATLTRIESLETQVGDDIFSTALPGEGLDERLTEVEQDLGSIELRVGQACTSMTLAGIFPAC